MKILLLASTLLAAGALDPLDKVPARLPISFRPLTQLEALRPAPGTPDFGRPCAPLPLIRGPLDRNIQVPQAHRDEASINLGTRLSAYFGTLHSHTGDSDAQGTVEEAYRYARDVAGLDFFAVTDHPEYWLLTEKDHLRRTQAAADAAARPDFVTLAGFEYSSPLWGHYTVLNTHGIHNAFEDADVGGFYRWLKRPEQRGALVAFAHPGFHEYRKSLEFRHFQLDPDLVPALIGIEVIHWDGYQPELHGYGGRFPYIDEALRLGWRVGALASEDVHFANWGTRDPTRVAVLVPRLTRDDLLEALRRRHFYATNNRHLQFAVNLQRRDHGYVTMGDTVAAGDLEPVAKLTARYYDKDCTDWPQQAEVVVNGHVVASYEFPTPGPGAAFPFAGEWTVDLPLGALAPSFYVYVRFYQDKDDSTFTESSPIFVAR